MAQTEAAERGVIRAIQSLHADGTFTTLLKDLDESVLPKFVALDLPIVEEPVFNVPPEPPVKIGPYDRFSRDRRQRHSEFESALQQWARRFRLTRDLTETGEGLPWILQFGRALCEGTGFTLAAEPRTVKMAPPGGWVHLDAPNPAKENRSDWLSRNRGALREHYSAVRKRQRAKPYPNQTKRNPDHYRWFVLHVCGGLKPGHIADKLGLLNVQEDAVRKGIKSVCDALDVK